MARSHRSAVCILDMSRNLWRRATKCRDSICFITIDISCISWPISHTIRHLPTPLTTVMYRTVRVTFKTVHPKATWALSIVTAPRCELAITFAKWHSSVSQHWILLYGWLEFDHRHGISNLWSCQPTDVQVLAQFSFIIRKHPFNFRGLWFFGVKKILSTKKILRALYALKNIVFVEKKMLRQLDNIFTL